MINTASTMFTATNGLMWAAFLCSSNTSI